MGQITSKIAGVENQRIALGPATARRILIRAFEIGRFSTNPQIHRYSLDSALTTVDTEMLIRHGKIGRSPMTGVSTVLFIGSRGRSMEEHGRLRLLWNARKIIGNRRG